MSQKNKHLIDLPRFGVKRIHILKKLYIEVEATGLTKVNDIFIKANEQLIEPLTRASWYRAKMKWGELIINHKPKYSKSKKIISSIPTPVEIFVKEHIERVYYAEVQDPQKYLRKRFTENEREKIFNNISDKFGNGASNLIKLCNDHGVAYMTFYSWIDDIPAYKKRWEITNKKHVLAFMRVYKEYFKEQKLKEILNLNETSWTINYRYVPSIDPVTKKEVMKMIETSASKTVKPRKLDNETQRLFMDSIKEMYAIEMSNEMVIASDIENASLDDLLKMQKELLEQLNDSPELE